MNVKKVITIALAVFVLCAVCCGAVSAFEVKNKATTTPPGSLVTGDVVTGSIQIMVPKDSLTVADKITFDTDLIGDSWIVNIYSGGALLRGSVELVKPYNYIDGFSLDYAYDITLDIQVTGTVSLSSAGKNITVLKVTATKTESTGVSAASSDPQYVYNSANLPGELAVLKSEIDALEARINVYAGYGWDVSGAQALLNAAKSQYQSAQSSSDTKTAYAKIEEARTSLKSAEQKLALASLSLSLSYTTYIDDIIKQLYAKGWNSEAMLLDTKNSGLKNIYYQQNEAYKDGKADAATIDKLAADSIALYGDALVYQGSANNPLSGILNILPFILIGLGAAAIIVVIVVVIVKKRKNSWDELG